MPERNISGSNGNHLPDRLNPDEFERRMKMETSSTASPSDVEEVWRQRLAQQAQSDQQSSTPQQPEDIQVSQEPGIPQQPFDLRTVLGAAGSPELGNIVEVLARNLAQASGAIRQPSSPQQPAPQPSTSTEVAVKPKADVVPRGKGRLAKTTPEGKKPRHEWKRWQRVTVAVGSIALAGVLVTAGFNLSSSGFNPFAAASDKTVSDLGNGVNIDDIKQGLSNLGEHCADPDKAPIIITIEGYEDVVVQLPSDDPADKGKLSSPAPFLSDDDLEARYHAGDITESQMNKLKGQLKDFYTSDGRSQVQLKKLPMYARVCAVGKDAIETRPNGTYVIRMADFAVTLEDIQGLSNKNDLMYSVWQQYSSNPTTNPENGEYTTLPYDYFVGEKKDNAAYNNGLTALKKTITDKDPLQIAHLVANAEVSAGNQIIDGVDGENNINFPDVNLPNVNIPGGNASFQNVLQEAVVKILGADPAKITWIGTDFPVEVQVAKDPTSGKPITEAHKLVGVSTGEVKLTKVEVTFGSPTEPHKPVIATPSPTATPTPTPTDGP